MVYCGVPATLRLELLDGTGAVVDSTDLMDENNGFRVSELDLAFPTVREVVAALPTRDGDYDTTRLLGPRVVSISGWITAAGTASRQDAVARLAYWCQPRFRPRLVYAVDPGEQPYAIGLRGSQLSSPYNRVDINDFQVSWVAPNPVAYSLAGHTLTLSAQGNFTGRAYNLIFPRTYPAGVGGSGLGTCTNGGDYPTWPRILIYGPCTNPAVYWVTPPGGAIVFTGLTVASGDYVDIDTFAQTVLLNSQAGASRYAQLDFTQTVWRPFYAGDTVLRFAPASFSPPCQAVVTWSDATL